MKRVLVTGPSGFIGRDNPLALEDAETILAAVNRLEPEFAGVIGRHLARVRTEDRRGRQPSAARRLLSHGRSRLIRNAYRRARKAAPNG